MTAYHKHIDWKTVAYALLGCYFLPALFFGTVTSAALGDGSSASGQTVANFLVFCYFLLPPLAAGYFTARYAARLPQFHVALVAIIGLLTVWATTSAPLSMYLAYSVASFAVTSLGAFVRLRSTPGETSQETPLK